MPGLIPLASVIEHFRKSDGTLNAGGTLEFFDNLTLSPKDVFNGYGSSVLLANPLQLNAGGFEPGVWLGPGSYRVRCRETAPTFPSVLGPVIWTKDYVNPIVMISTYNYTVPTTLTTVQNGAFISSNSDITLPGAGSAGAGWSINIKNIGTSFINIIRMGVGDTINGVSANIRLPPNESMLLVVIGAASGFDLYANSLLQSSGADTNAILQYGLNGPAWASIDTRNTGGKLYLYSSFT